MDSTEPTNLPDPVVEEVVTTPDATEETTEQLETPDTQVEESQAEEIETVEIERDGKKLKIPKLLESELMMQSDYTRKTQTVAEERKAVQAERERVQQEAQMHQELIDDVAELKGIEKRLRMFQNIDWQRVPPERKADLMLEQMQLSNAHNAAAARINERKSYIEAERERETATAISQATEELNKPDEKFAWAGRFDQSVSAKLTAFGQELGFTQEELRNTVHPKMIKTLHLAMLGAEALKKQKEASKAPKVVANPVPTVATGKTVTAITNPDKLTPDQWVKWREKQLAAKR